MRLNTLLIDGHDGTLSSKRVVTFSAFVLCSIAFLADLFWDYNISPNVFEGMIFIAIAGLGATASEKFANRKLPATPAPIPSYYTPINKKPQGTPLPITEEKEI